MKRRVVSDKKAFLLNFHEEVKKKRFARYKDEGTALKLSCRVFNLYASGNASEAEEAELTEKVSYFRALHGKDINLGDERGRW